MENKKKNPVATIILAVISILWMYPIALILFNSLKKESAITTSTVFSIPNKETWNGLSNFVASVTQMDFLKSFWYSLVISVMSVVLILLCCSMCAWYIVRVNGKLSKVCVQYGSSVPDGNVYSGKDSRYPETEQSVQHLHYLSGIWSRAGCVYVYRFCKRNSAGN